MGCDTQLVTTNGGTGQHPDIIRIPERHCTTQNETELLIVAHGATQIEDTTFNRGQNVQISVMEHLLDGRDEVLNFSAAVTSNSSVSYEIILSELALYPKPHKHSQGQASITLDGRLEQRINFEISHHFQTHQLLAAPTITFRTRDGDYAGNLMSDTKGNVRNVHFLSGHSHGCKSHLGMVGLSNYYKVMGSCWNITGAEEASNYFLLEADTLPGTAIRGGAHNSENTLDAEGYGSEEKLYFDFILNWMGLKFSDGTRVRGINVFKGRSNKSDEVRLSCDSGLVTIDGKGGQNTNNPDKIIIQNPKGSKPCKDVTIRVDQFTKVENSATTGNYIYDIMLTSGIDTLEFVATQENNHILQYRFNPSQLISSISHNTSKVQGDNISKKTRLNHDIRQKTFTFYYFSGNSSTLELSVVFNETLSYPAVRKANRKINPQLIFVSSDDLVSSEIQLDPESNHLLARWDIRSTAWSEIIGLEGVSGNKFLVNITSASNQLQRITGGYQDNEVWLYAIPENGLILHGSEFGMNSLRLSESFAEGEELLVNLAETRGSISSLNNPNVAMVSLDNMNEFYGRLQSLEIVAPSCSTTLIVNADKIILDPEACIFFYLDIYLNATTEVVILQQETDSDNFTSISEPEGEFRFYFQSPTSFTPLFKERYGHQFRLSDFIYNLPLNLESFTEIGFWPWNNTIFYSLEKSSLIQHQILSGLDETDEFYRQPKLLTRDGCELRVDRVGAITAICSETFDRDLTQKIVIANTAVRLGISIIWRFGDEIAFFGHNSSEQRNILTTSSNFTNHLFGGGAKDTIYEILYLQQNVTIYSGLTEDDDSVKQTIDLTDIIVPIRQKNGNKYVPLLQANGSDLIISLPNYAAHHPGSITITNGVQQASSFQLLLNSAAMEFSPVNKLPRTRRDLPEEAPSNQWKITPKPIQIEPGYVFSISQEELEHGHYITLTDSETNSTFTMSKDGTDLIISDVKSFSFSTEPTLIILSDFYEIKENPVNSTTQILEQIVTVALPGLNFTLNNSQIIHSVHKITAPDWNEVLEEVEEELLQNMPEVPRVFKIHRNTKLFVIVVLVIFLGLLSILGCAYLRWKYCWSYHWKLGDERRMSVFEIDGIAASKNERGSEKSKL